MVLFSIPDIRLFWSTDERFLSQFKKGEITTFRPYSKYPPCIKDISFWIPQNGRFHEGDLYDLVRDTAGDLVEDVKMVGKFGSDPCFVNLF
jgi:phenylalanyl-tRNA synthetase alpha chain